MRDRPYLSVIAFGLVTMLTAFAVREGGPSDVEAIDVDPVIWTIGQDYPATLPGDIELPIRTVYIKTHDGSNWMSTYDDHPSAISGPAAIQNLINIYGDQGIKVAAWFNPTGTDYAAQLEIAKQVIDSGVTALYADVEPYPQFCYLHCKQLADNLWKPLSAARPNAELGVIYDPRPWWWEQQALNDWFSVSDAALPMCYWDSYSGQGVWNDAAGCVLQAHADLATLAPGKDLAYIPMLQGNSTAAKFEKALDAAVSVGSERVSVWRRGVIGNDVWELIGQYQEPDFFFCRQALADRCLFREVSDANVYMMAGGAKFTLVSLEAFNRMGLSFDDVQVVEDGFLANVPLVPQDGTLLREEESADAWVIYNGGRFRLADVDFAGLALNAGAVVKIATGALGQVPTVPHDFARFREFSHSDDHLVVRGMRIRIDATVESALQLLGISKPANVVPDLALEAFPTATIGRGDTDCSGNIEPNDVLNALQIGSGLPNGAICYQSADVNCDGTAASMDALLILAFVVGNPNLIPNDCDPVGTPSGLG
ncbi:MAG TPA: hypothetical protein VMR52_07160 [Dehalococcoidia bacterium]|nr:hypothetical protein [Dehalococcoidia bacterium]